MLPIWLGSAIAFVYGIVVGSFLNVCIYRMPAELSIVKPPSHCPKCDTKLRGVDLVPLLSFLFLGRKCRYCGMLISWRYFIVELITGALFVATYLKFGYSIDFFAYVLFISALIVTFAVDIEHFIIPDEVSILGVVVGVGRDVAHLIAGDNWLMHIPLPFTDWTLPMLPSVAGIVVCGGVFYLIAYIGFYVFKPKDEEELMEYEGAMGGGDVKLAAATGAVLGVLPAMVSFLIAVLFGTIIGVTLMIIKARAEKKGLPWRTEIPFGPYMVLGSLAVIFFYPHLTKLWEMWVHLIARQ
ncbi:MAG: prepilin peptidase [Armatimonadetes bacterium]|nr:prepilin peptidase [Armatimonadota bacterium]